MADLMVSSMIDLMVSVTVNASFNGWLNCYFYD